MHILLCCFQQLDSVVLALASVPFGLTAAVFWMYVCATLVLIVGLIRILKELPQERGVDKIMPFGQLFFAIPMAVFGSELRAMRRSIIGSPRGGWVCSLYLSPTTAQENCRSAIRPGHANDSLRSRDRVDLAGHRGEGR